MNKKIITWMLVFLLVVSLASAIGVSPIRKVVDFEPGKEHDLTIKIKNDEEKDMKALVYARGDLEQYIGLKDPLITITKEESEKTAGYTLKLPESMTRPGVHKTDLVVVEFPSSFGTGQEATVSATASVASQLWVRVPFPGKYAEGTLHIEAGNVNENVNFAINLLNFGRQDIQNAKATIKILGATYEEIGRIETESVSISTQGEAMLTGKWLADVFPGKYRAVAEITYDDKRLVLEKNFEVGNLFIDVVRIDTKPFTLGEVAVFDLFLESQWNDPISNVFGEITVLDSSGTEYDKFKTAAINLAPLGQGVLKAYWDTQGIEVGTYSLRVLIHYEEKVTEKLVEAEVNIDSISTSLGITAQVVAEGGLSRDSLLTILVIILIVINVAWFTYFIRQRKKK